MQFLRIIWRDRRTFCTTLCNKKKFT